MTRLEAVFLTGMAREISPKTNPRRKTPLEAASYKGWQNEDFRKRTPKGDGINLLEFFNDFLGFDILESEPRKGTEFIYRDSY